MSFEGDKCSPRRQNHQQEVSGRRGETEASDRDQHLKANGPPQHLEALRVLS